MQLKSNIGKTWKILLKAVNKAKGAFGQTQQQQDAAVSDALEEYTNNVKVGG